MSHQHYRKIDDQELYRLLVEEGNSQHEVAVLLGVSEAAVSKRVKVLNIQLIQYIRLLFHFYFYKS